MLIESEVLDMVHQAEPDRLHCRRRDQGFAELHVCLASAGAESRASPSERCLIPFSILRSMESYRGDAPRVASGAWKDAFARTTLFTPLQRARFSFVHEADFAAVVARVTSVSFIAALPPAEFARVVEKVRVLLATHPETAGRSTFELPYRTGIYWTERI